MEVHVELSTRRKMFSRSGSPAHERFEDAGPNTLLDPTVLGLPGALPVMNGAAVELAMVVGLALGCEVAGVSRWDRKSYFYPDLPKAYQISQHERPLCVNGSFEVWGMDERGVLEVGGESRRIGIVRAHLEEDAGKLLHEGAGGRAIEHSVVDLNRAGTPLLEIVTGPDFRSSVECVWFARQLRQVVRFVGASRAVMQRGQMRLEPNVNCVLHLGGGRTVRTPITEVKNLNSFRSLEAAIEHEREMQPARWREDGIEAGAGTKTTRGWDEERGVTFVQRSKEDAHDYRYFPDPDLPAVVVDEAWRGRALARVGELPVSRVRRWVGSGAMSAKDAAAMSEERVVADMYDAAVGAAVGRGVSVERAGRAVANLMLQSGAKRANELTGELRREASHEGLEAMEAVLVTDLGITAEQVGEIAWLREGGELTAAGADEVFGRLCEVDGSMRGRSARAVAETLGVLMVRDEAALERWCRAAMAALPAEVEALRSGKQQAIGRLVGEVKKQSGGAADPAAARAWLAANAGG